MNMTVIQAYAPISTAKQEEIEDFYAELQTQIDEVPDKTHS